MTTKHFATLVGAAAVAAAVAWAPLAAADPNQSRESCELAGQSSTVCQRPVGDHIRARGDIEIISTPPSFQFYPYGSPPPIAG
jgi:hypothetical protein